MKLFNRIIQFFRSIKLSFPFARKKPKPIFSESQLEKETSDINKELAELSKILIEEPNEVTKSKVDVLIKEKTKRELYISSITPHIKEIRKLIFADIASEIIELNTKLFQLDQIKHTQNRKPIAFDSKSKEKLNKIKTQFRNSPQYLNTNSPDTFNKNNENLQIRNNSLLKRFEIREEEKLRLEQQLKKQIKAKLVQLQMYLEQNDLENATEIVEYIKPALQKNRFPDLTQKFERFENKFLQLQQKEYERKQEELIRKQKEEAEKRRIEREKREEEERLKRLQLEEQRKKEEEKKKEKQNQLNSLLIKKTNWKDFERILEQNNIFEFYHFTPRANIESIKKQRALYSWNYCEKNKITIPIQGGDLQSKELDRKYGLEDYVRVSFCNDHPMAFRLRDQNLIYLKISLDVAYFKNTLFSNMNAADHLHKHGPTIDDLERINFSATKARFVRKESPIFKEHQAEVLIKTWIPIEYIKNIHDF